jgi:hypothetical protein
MAGDRHGDRIRAAGPGDRPDRLGRPDRGGELRIARRAARRDLPESGPDALLAREAGAVGRNGEDAG